MRTRTIALSGPILIVGLCAPPAMADWVDTFDTYDTATKLPDQSTWEAWGNDANAANFYATTDRARSAPNSVVINGADDGVHQYTGYDSGRWIYTAWVYVPTGMDDLQYFILLNTYPASDTNNWSLQLELDGPGATVNDFNGASSVTMLQDAWAQIRVEIDLDQDVQNVFYNGVPLVSKSWTGGVEPGGAVNIAAVDLWANESDSDVYYDDMSLRRPCFGDLDDDGTVGTADLLALLGAWGDPGGPADVDGDGMVGTADLLALLAAWGPCPACAGLEDVAAELLPQTGMDFTLDSKDFYADVTEQNVDTLREEVLAEWVYPEATVAGSTMTVEGVHRIGDQGFTDEELAGHRDSLAYGLQSLQPGDTVYELDYTIEDPQYGTFSFTVLAYEDGSGCAKFDPFTFMIPLLRESPVLGNKYIATTNPGVNHDVEFKVEWAIGDATGHGDLHIQCEGNQVVLCQATTGHTASYLAEAECTNEEPAIFPQEGKECCSVVFHFGFANGFKGLEIGADGFSISITGAMGYSGTEESIVCKCCPEGEPCD